MLPCISMRPPLVRRQGRGYRDYRRITFAYRIVMICDRQRNLHTRKPRGPGWARGVGRRGWKVEGTRPRAQRVPATTKLIWGRIVHVCALPPPPAVTYTPPYAAPVFRSLKPFVVPINADKVHVLTLLRGPRSLQPANRRSYDGLYDVDTVETCRSRRQL